MDAASTTSDLRTAVQWVAILNLSYFGVEFAVALHIGSVSLFADSVDFLEDTLVNALILAALAWSAANRAAGRHVARGHIAGSGHRDVVDGMA